MAKTVGILYWPARIRKGAGRPLRAIDPELLVAVRWTCGPCADHPKQWIRDNGDDHDPCRQHGDKHEVIGHGQNVKMGLIIPDKQSCVQYSALVA
jgi:hypothetical protein